MPVRLLSRAKKAEQESRRRRYGPDPGKRRAPPSGQRANPGFRRLPTAYSLLFFCQLPPAHCLLPSTYHLPPTTYRSFPPFFVPNLFVSVWLFSGLCTDPPVTATWRDVWGFVARAFTARGSYVGERFALPPCSPLVTNRGWRRRWLCSVCVVLKGLVWMGREAYTAEPWRAAGFPTFRADGNSSPQASRFSRTQTLQGEHLRGPRQTATGQAKHSTYAWNERLASRCESFLNHFFVGLGKPCFCLNAKPACIVQ